MDVSILHVLVDSRIGIRHRLVLTLQGFTVYTRSEQRRQLFQIIEIRLRTPEQSQEQGLSALVKARCVLDNFEPALEMLAGDQGSPESIEPWTLKQVCLKRRLGSPYMCVFSSSDISKQVLLSFVWRALADCLRRTWLRN